MNTKTIKTFLFIFSLLIILAGIYIGLRNLDYFLIKEVKIEVQGPVKGITVEMQRNVNLIKGRNTFEVSLAKLKKDLSAFSAVEKVTAKRFFPGTIIIQVDWITPQILAFVKDKEYYLVSDEKLIVTDTNTWDNFKGIATVELNEAYAKLIEKWGADEGFNSMLELTQELGSNRLITQIKYDNNNGNSFGRMVLEIPSCNVQIWVREPVSGTRLGEAINIVLEETKDSSDPVRYDLYSTALVRRT